MTTLALSTELAEQLTSLGAHEVESGGVLLVAEGQDGVGGHRLLGVKYIPVPESAYLRREAQRLSISSHGWMPALQEAAESGLAAIWTHSHPGRGSSPKPSRHDREVDQQLHDVFMLRSGSDFYGSLIVSQSESGSLAFTGALIGIADQTIDLIVVTGETLRVISAADTPIADLGELHSRHVLAFGDGIPRALSTLKIAVVGAGGTGSATAEMLVRLGARKMLIIDDDTLSLSNTTRVFGSTVADVGRPKVEVLSEHLKRIAPDLNIEPIVGRITSRSIARRLVTSDVVFGCTDDNAGRARLSRLPYAYSNVVIDCGVQISSSNGEISGIFGRVTSLYRGAPCLLCRNRIDLARLAAEERPAEEQEALVAQGYAPELGQTEPAVVTFTASVAAASVGELVEMLVGYGELPRPTELILRFHDRDVRANSVPSRSGCYCDLGSRADRLGDSGLFLGVNWAS